MSSSFASLLGNTPPGYLSPSDMPAPVRPAAMPGKAANEAQALQVGREFETMFLSEMLRPMFESVKPDKLFGGGNGESMFQSLQVDEYAKGLTKAGGVGIADAIKREILRMQENARVPAAN